MNFVDRYCIVFRCDGSWNLIIQQSIFRRSIYFRCARILLLLLFITRYKDSCTSISWYTVYFRGVFMHIEAKVCKNMSRAAAIAKWCTLQFKHNKKACKQVCLESRQLKRGREKRKRLNLWASRLVRMDFSCVSVVWMECRGRDNLTLDIYWLKKPFGNDFANQKSWPFFLLENFRMWKIYFLSVKSQEREEEYFFEHIYEFYLPNRYFGSTWHSPTLLQFLSPLLG